MKQRIEDLLMNREVFRELFGDVKRVFSQNWEVNYPPYFQLLNLGLEDEVDSMAGLCVLDIGCGNGGLVKYLRERGVIAEGIDISAPAEEGYMKQLITSIIPKKGAIPRVDSSYDLVVANSVEPLNENLSSIGTRPSTEGFLRAYFIVLEGLRVLKKGGRFVITPGVDKIEESMQSEFSNGLYRVERKQTDFSSQLEDFASRDMQARQITIDAGLWKGCGIPEPYRYNTVIYK